MTIHRAVQPDEPIMKAWTKWQMTEEFVNVLKWSEDLMHIRENGAGGELWAAFVAGWLAAGGRID